jgi:hypothetical protein
MGLISLYIRRITGFTHWEIAALIEAVLVIRELQKQTPRPESYFFRGFFVGPIWCMRLSISNDIGSNCLIFIFLENRDFKKLHTDRRKFLWGFNSWCDIYKIIKNKNLRQ